MQKFVRGLFVGLTLMGILHTDTVTAAAEKGSKDVFQYETVYLVPEAVSAETIQEPEVVYEDVQETGSQKRIYYTVVAVDETGSPQSRLSTELQDWVYEMCAEYDIAGYEQLMIAKLYCESSFRTSLQHTNKNGTTDSGIAQINSCNHARLRRELGITDFMDSYQSIRCGVYMMAGNLKANDYDEEKALVAYNMGQGKVNAGVTTSKYSRRVLLIRDNLIPDSEVTS